LSTRTPSRVAYAPRDAAERGNDQVGSKLVRLACYDFGKFGGEPFAQSGDLFVVQEQDGAVERMVINRIAPRAHE
jgi:hypothetical protein